MSDESSEEGTIAAGFDRGVSYSEMKQKFIAAYDKNNKDIDALDSSNPKYEANFRMLLNRSIYLLIAMIQLCNGSRVSEACSAFGRFLSKGCDEKVVVKLAKSKCLRKKRNGEEYVSDSRYRKMQFPKWIVMKHEAAMKESFDEMNNKTRRVLNYMIRNFDCNTHSLRYAFINFMLYEQKKEMTVVAKHVGHSNTNQLVRYTQAKEADKLFDIDDD
jgi:integrase